jgi:hypothetical protein
MGTRGFPKAVRFFTSLIHKGEHELARTEQELVSLLGNVAARTDPGPFLHTRYYDKEMGEGLLRCFLLFDPMLERDSLPDVKLKTNEIEIAYSIDGKRTVNIDPGYLSLEQVVLATTKGHAHRLYLGKGIFGDLTLMFADGTFRTLPWTYPDYGSIELIDMFNRWREAYKRRLRSMVGCVRPIEFAKGERC